MTAAISTAPAGGPAAGQRRVGWAGRSAPRGSPARPVRPPPTGADTAPAHRANLYPEVTDPICRLPLPTFFCSTRGC